MSGKVIAGIAGMLITVGAGIVCAVECHLRKKNKTLPEPEDEEDISEEVDVDGYLEDMSYKIYELKTDMGLIKEMDPLEIDDDDISLED